MIFGVTWVSMDIGQKFSLNGINTRFIFRVIRKTRTTKDDRSRVYFSTFKIDGTSLSVDTFDQLEEARRIAKEIDN